MYNRTTATDSVIDICAVYYYIIIIIYYWAQVLLLPSMCDGKKRARILYDDLFDRLKVF